MPAALASALLPPTPVERMEQLSLKQSQAVGGAAHRASTSGDSCSSLGMQQEAGPIPVPTGPVAPYQARPVQGPLITHNMTPAQPVLEVGQLSQQVGAQGGG